MVCFVFFRCLHDLYSVNGAKHVVYIGFLEVSCGFLKLVLRNVGLYARFRLLICCFILLE